MPHGQHARVYNAPSVTAVAAILIGDENDTTTTKSRKIVVGTTGSGFDKIPSTHTSYNPLSYVMTHMHSDKGWTYSIPTYKDNEIDTTKNVTPLDYYAHRLQ